jgi:hypothetical protein
VLTGTAIRSSCEEFRLDWVALRSQLRSPAPPEQILAMIQRAKAFRMAIEALVMKETQDWATEFQNNLAQVEKDLKLQVDQAKAQRIKAEEELRARIDREKAEREKAALPGSLQATIENAGDTDDFRFEAKLETDVDVVARETVTSSQTWARLAIPAGQYKLTVSALVKQQHAVVMTVVSVKPGETTQAELKLPAAARP